MEAVTETRDVVTYIGLGVGVIALGLTRKTHGPQTVIQVIRHGYSLGEPEKLKTDGLISRNIKLS